MLFLILTAIIECLNPIQIEKICNTGRWGAIGKIKTDFYSDILAVVNICTDSGFTRRAVCLPMVKLVFNSL